MNELYLENNKKVLLNNGYQFIWESLNICPPLIYQTWPDPLQSQAQNKV